MIHPCPLPDDALLQSYRAAGAYTDCFATDLPGAITHEQFVTAFYTTFVFKLERWILTWAVAKPSTDAQARELAAGSIGHFAAWSVEKRADNQLLLSDYRGRTRSWLMVTPIPGGTRLYFGSAVVPAKPDKAGKSALGWIFSGLLGFHKLYSVILLNAARSRLTA